MTEFTVLGTRLRVSPLFFAILTLFLLIDKNGIAGAAVLFSFLHELGHFFALLCVESAPETVDIMPFGIRMVLPKKMSTAKKTAVLISGFAVNFMLATLFFIIEKKYFAYINLAIGIFTAVPLSSTDGGSVLGILLEERFPESGGKLFKIISLSFLFAVSAILIITGLYTGNCFLFIAVLYMVLCTVKKTA